MRCYLPDLQGTLRQCVNGRARAPIHSGNQAPDEVAKLARRSAHRRKKFCPNCRGTHRQCSRRCRQEFAIEGCDCRSRSSGFDSPLRKLTGGCHRATNKNNQFGRGVLSRQSAKTQGKNADRRPQQTPKAPTRQRFPASRRRTSRGKQSRRFQHIPAPGSARAAERSGWKNSAESW